MVSLWPRKRVHVLPIYLLVMLKNRFLNDTLVPYLISTADSFMTVLAQHSRAAKNLKVGEQGKF